MKTQAILTSLYPIMTCLSQPEDCEIAKDSPGRGRSDARYLGVGGQRQGRVFSSWAFGVLVSLEKCLKFWRVDWYVLQ